jgi:hypothetical protein
MFPMLESKTILITGFMPHKPRLRCGLDRADRQVTTVGIGVDGTCMLSCDQKWWEVMTGGISLYDRHGERLQTIYVGAAPE